MTNLYLTKSMLIRSIMSRYNVHILPAVFTPMHDDGSINFDSIRALYQHNVSSGYKGVFLNGTTGECMSLTREERQRILETWVEARKKENNEAFKIFAHIGSTNLQEAAEMAEHAQSLGVEGIAMVPTFYFRPTTLPDLIEQCRFVAAAAPNTPFYFYNIPGLTGVNFPLTQYLKAAVKAIPTFAGLKNSFNNLVDYQQCLHLGDEKHAMYWGTDEVFMMVYAAGTRHYVGSTYNYMGTAYFQMLDAYHAGDHDTLSKVMTEATRVYEILNDYNSLVAGKAIMRHIGLDCGPVRRPLQSLPNKSENEMIERLRKTEFFNWAGMQKDRSRTEATL
jgi:N-acetylneuraminate lyase